MKAPKPPSGALWLQHDGFRVIARKDDGRVKLYNRPGLSACRRERRRSAVSARKRLNSAFTMMSIE
jgi:hypothetical protein